VVVAIALGLRPGEVDGGTRIGAHAPVTLPSPGASVAGRLHSSGTESAGGAGTVAVMADSPIWSVAPHSLGAARERLVG
jgi:hypothetical protein